MDGKLRLTASQRVTDRIKTNIKHVLKSKSTVSGQNWPQTLVLINYIRVVMSPRKSAVSGPEKCAQLPRSSGPRQTPSQNVRKFPRDFVDLLDVDLFPVLSNVMKRSKLLLQIFPMKFVT